MQSLQLMICGHDMHVPDVYNFNRFEHIFFLIENDVTCVFNFKVIHFPGRIFDKYCIEFSSTEYGLTKATIYLISPHERGGINFAFVSKY